MKKSLRILQRDLSDCGPACLASICAFYKLTVSVSRIREYAAADKQGTSVMGLVEAAKRLGLQAKGVKAGFESIHQAPLPCIAHVLINETFYHYLVIGKISKRYVIVMDPAEGRFKKLRHEEFKKIWTGIMVLLEPGDSFVPGNQKLSHTTRFWQLAAPQRQTILHAMAGAIVYSLLGLSTAIYVQKIVDLVLTDINTRLLNLLSVIMIVLLLLQFFIGIVKACLSIEAAQHIDARLILGYYRHLLHLPQRFFDAMRVGEIISRLNDAVKIRTLISDVTVNLLVNMLILVFSFMLMLFYYWKLALILLVILPVYSGLYYLSDRINKKWQRRIMENSAALESQLVGSLHSASTIKKLGIEACINEKTENNFFTLLNTLYRESIYQVYILVSAEFLTKAFTVIVLWAGSYFVIRRELSAGELLSFYALISYFTNPVIYLLNANKQIREALIAADRLFEIMDLESEKDDRPMLRSGQDIHGDIHFSNVSFRYGYGDNLFNELELVIRKGSVTGIVGESGSGKSTLAGLLQYLYPVSAGSITFNNLDLRYIDKTCLRKTVSAVAQQTDLFPGTIIENIAIGYPEPDMKKILDITGRLGITDFTDHLPDGMYTVLHELGNNLSGGQKQRIALARAMYRAPSILILDEATAALDALSENKVLETINWFASGGNTTIIIAHRLSMLTGCDNINVLHKGRIAEQGTHDQLMKKAGIYWRIFGQPNT